MSIKGAMIAASVPGMFAMGASGVASAKSGDEVMCDGVNACKGTGACKGAHNACAGQNGCKGQGHVKGMQGRAPPRGSGAMPSCTGRVSWRRSHRSFPDWRDRSGASALPSWLVGTWTSTRPPSHRCGSWERSSPSGWHPGIGGQCWPIWRSSNGPAPTSSMRVTSRCSGWTRFALASGPIRGAPREAGRRPQVARGCSWHGGPLATNRRAGICRVVKNSVTSGRLCNLPQPVPMKTSPTVSRARLGPMNAILSSAVRSRAAATDRAPDSDGHISFGRFESGRPVDPKGARADRGELPGAAEPVRPDRMRAHLRLAVSIRLRYRSRCTFHPGRRTGRLCPLRTSPAAR
jgi:hypothetical protein